MKNEELFNQVQRKCLECALAILDHKRSEGEERETPDSEGRYMDIAIAIEKAKLAGGYFTVDELVDELEKRMERTEVEA